MTAPTVPAVKCVLCYYDPGLRPPPDGEPRPAVFVVNGLSTCEEHMGEAVIGPDLNRAIHSMKTQMRLREESSITREGTW